MITDNFQKSNFSDQQQVAAWWLSGIESVSVQGKKCMRIFCKEAQEQMWLKFTVELLVLWQLGILSSGPEVTLIFYFCDPGFSPRDLDPKGLCSLVYKPCFGQGIPWSFCKIVVLLSFCLSPTRMNELLRSLGWGGTTQSPLGAYCPATDRTCWNTLYLEWDTPYWERREGKSSVPTYFALRPSPQAYHLPQYTTKSSS